VIAQRVHRGAIERHCSPIMRFVAPIALSADI
jgi:hypothetical protein